MNHNNVAKRHLHNGHFRAFVSTNEPIEKEPVEKIEYQLKEQLYAAIRPVVGEMYLNNIVAAIQNGVGEDIVLKLQKIGNDECGLARLCGVLPQEAVIAIRQYRKKEE